MKRKITEGTVFSKARKYAAKAVMPGHLADIIFKTEISRFLTAVPET